MIRNRGTEIVVHYIVCAPVQKTTMRKSHFKSAVSLVTVANEHAASIRRR